MIKKLIFPNKLCLAMNIFFAILLLISIIGLITIACLPIYGFDYIQELEDTTIITTWTKTTMTSTSLSPDGTEIFSARITITNNSITILDMGNEVHKYKITPYKLYLDISYKNNTDLTRTIVLHSPERYNIYASFLSLFIIAISYSAIYITCYFSRHKIHKAEKYIKAVLTIPLPPKPPKPHKPTKAQRIAELERQVQELNNNKTE